VKKLKEFIWDAGAWGVASELASLVLYILSVTSKTDVASTLQDAEMVVETKNGSFSGTRQKVSDGSYYSPTRSSTKLEKMNDLIASTT